MQPFPIAWEPTNLLPCFVARSRREVNHIDATNSRLVEMWQTDAPALQNARRDLEGTSRWNDMNPTPSRLYRESLQQNQPYQTPTASSQEVKKVQGINSKLQGTLSTIQSYTTRLSDPGVKGDPVMASTLRGGLKNAQDLYGLLLAEQKQDQIDLLGKNPYFEKYDVASDSRNVARELRSVVSEDIVDRGVSQSQRLLQREFDTRWTPQGFAEGRGFDSLNAYELMRPKFNVQERQYR